MIEPWGAILNLVCAVIVARNVVQFALLPKNRANTSK